MRSSRILVAFALAGCPAPANVSAPIPAAAEAPAPPAPASAPAPAPARVEAPPPRGVVECLLEGAIAIRAGEKLRLGENGDVEARFTGRGVHVRVERIDTKTIPSIATATVRAPSSPPALLLHAKLDASAIPLRAARDIAVVATHVVIPRGAPLVLVSGEGTTVGVRPQFGDFADATARATCEEVEMGGDANRPPNGGGTRMHLVSRRVPLFADARDGAVVFELSARRDGATFTVSETRGTFRHVHYDDGLRIDGWMRASDLAPGEGPDCDDCHGGPMDVDDVCPPKGCADEKGGPFHARRKVAVRDRPSPEGQPLGWLEEDGEVRIVGRSGTYARVEALRGEIAPPRGGLFIDGATLDPKGK